MTAEEDALHEVLAFARGTPDLVRRYKTNPPFTTAVKDQPRPRRGTCDSALFAPEAVRHVLKISCMPEMEHDAQILEILEHHRLEVASVGSRAFDTHADGTVQELTVMMHGGSAQTVQKALADITILIGVKHVDIVDPDQASQYMQVVFQRDKNRDIPAILARYPDMHCRGLMTDDFQLVATGTMSLHEAARARKDLVNAEIGNRPNSVILSNYGQAITQPETRWPKDDTAFWETVAQVQRRCLQSFIDGRRQDDL